MIDLFCGTGGFAEGFVGHGGAFELKYAIDYDANSTATAAANHTRAVVETADIRGKSPKGIRGQVGDVDVIIGGPPCQGYSSLRPNRSSEVADDRNSLYTRFATFVEVFRPKVVVLENVVGLVTHDSGRTLDALLTAFTSLRYNVDWRILNAASFGVPQKRERFIMLAARDHAPVQFPTPTHRFEGRAIGCKDKSRLLRADDAARRALGVMDAIGDLPRLSRSEQASCYDSAPQNDYQRARRAGATVVTLHRASSHSDKMLRVIQHAGASIKSLPADLVTSGFSSCYSRLAADEPATTITVKFQSPASSKCIHPIQDRTLTPREAARLQSFDDSYLFTGSMTDIARQIGNAVPPLLGRAIATSVSAMLS